MFKKMWLSRQIIGWMALVLSFLTGLPGLVIAEEKGGEIPVYKGHYIGEIMPTPKEVEYKDNYLPIIDLRKKKAKACIVIGEEAAIPEKTSAQEVRSRIKYLAGEAIPQIDILTDTDNYLDYDVVIAIGKPTTNKLINRCCNKYKVRVPEKKEGYIIRVVKNKGKKIVLCAGNDDAGVYFSAQSLNQLFTKRGKYLSLREVSVIDWPSFLIRDWRGWPRPRAPKDFHEWTGMFKINTYGIHGDILRSEGTWRAPSKRYKEIVKEACTYAKERGLDTAQYANPYMHEGRPAGMPWPIPASKILSFEQKPIKISDPRDIESLINLYRISLDNGGRKIVMMIDDLLPVDEDNRYVLPYEEDREKFGSLANAHVYLINEVHKRLKKDYPDYQMIVCPVYYWIRWSGQQKTADKYLEELGKKVSSDVIIFWTGSWMISFAITKEDVSRYSKLIRRKPMLYDNSIGYWHPAGDIFEGCHKSVYPHGFAEMSSGIRISGGMGETSKVEVISHMDYAWNPDAYDSETSLRKSLAIVGGEDMVDTLISFRDNYYRMKEKPKDNLSQFKREFRELTRDLDKIESKLENKPLAKSLRGCYEACYWAGVRQFIEASVIDNGISAACKKDINFFKEKARKCNFKIIMENLEGYYLDGLKQFITSSVIDNGYLYPISSTWEKDFTFRKKELKKCGFKNIDKNVKDIQDSLNALVKLKRYKIITLENKYIKVDIIPGLGGRIYRMIDKTKGVNYLYAPVIRVLSNRWTDYGGYEEYSNSRNHSPGWNEEYEYEIVQGKGEQRIRLSCLLSNEYLITREISVKDGLREIEINSNLKNISPRIRKSSLKIHPIFATGNINDNVLYILNGKNRLKKYPLGNSLGCVGIVYQIREETELPKGFWLVANRKENIGILNSFEEDEIESCFVWEDKKSNVYTLELFSKVRELKPGESLSINHKYTLLDDVSNAIGKYVVIE